MNVKPVKIIVHARHLLPVKRLPADPDGPKVVISISIPHAKPSTWTELHLRAMHYKGGDDHIWLNFFGLRIVGKCDCKKNWREELTKLPPDFNNYFAWSVEAHNLVNKRLGKPILTLEEAQGIWTPKVLTQ